MAVVSASFLSFVLISSEQNQLLMDFPLIPKPHIRKILASHRNFYAPTHLHFLTELEATSEKGQSLSYVPKKKASMIPVKGKGKALEDVEFEQEREWLLHNIQKRNIEKDEKVAEQLIEEEGTGVECGCCFSSYPFASCFHNWHNMLLTNVRIKWSSVPMPICSARHARSSTAKLSSDPMTST